MKILAVNLLLVHNNKKKIVLKKKTILVCFKLYLSQKLTRR